MQVLRLVFVPTSVIVLLAAAWIVPLPLFREEPGRLVSLGDKVEVRQPGSPPLAGDFMFATVEAAPATTVDLVRAAIDDHVTVTPTGSFLPPGVDENEYFQLQRTVFDFSADVAAAVALRAAGYPVDVEALQGDGALVLEVAPGAPADRVLRAGDVITAVNGRPVGTAEQLRAAIRSPGRGGQPIELTFNRAGQERRGRVTPRPLQSAGGPAIGVFTHTVRPRLRLPVPVEVDAGEIGGPSAGLMIAVTVFDKAEGDVDLAAGRVVAGTGSLAEDGRVGRVGGIRLKVLAADLQDADLFLAPAVQLAEARSGLPPRSDMQVLGVATFDDAVRVLRESVAQSAAATAAAILPCPPWSVPGGCGARSRATPHREPGQGRKAAAISGWRRVPRIGRASSPVRQ